MKVIKVYPSGFAANSYILTADNKNCVVVDPAQSSIFDRVSSENLTCRAVLLTHGHYDHVGGVAEFQRAGAKVYCGEGDADKIFSILNFGLCDMDEIPRFAVDETLRDGQKIELCGITFSVISTPGHTAGSVCYVAERCLFSGDTLFFESVGRADLPTGSAKELFSSVKKLYALDGDYKVYCGHEGDTTLSHERENNPYVR